VKLHDAKVGELNKKVSVLQQEKNAFIKQKNIPMAKRKIQEKHRVVLQIARFSQLKEACHNMQESIFDSSVVKQTFTVLSDVSWTFRNVKFDQKFNEQLERFSDQVENMKFDLADMNDALSSDAVVQSLSFLFAQGLLFPFSRDVATCSTHHMIHLAVVYIFIQKERPDERESAVRERNHDFTDDVCVERRIRRGMVDGFDLDHAGQHGNVQHSDAERNRGPDQDPERVLLYLCALLVRDFSTQKRKAHACDITQNVHRPGCGAPVRAVVE
jgi:hypothetical protein